MIAVDPIVVRPHMTDVEIALLEAVLRPSDRVWEWGSGHSTVWLARRCRYVTSVEHDAGWAQTTVSLLSAFERRNASVLYVPPDGPWHTASFGDGDYDTFRRYVTAFSGRGVDVVLIDGRARVACARQVTDGAEFGPSPDLRVLLHNADREEYEPIWRTPEEGGFGYLEIVERAGRLLLLKPRGL